MSPVRPAAIIASRTTPSIVGFTEDNEKLVGVFTERDGLFRVLAEGLDADTTARLLKSGL